LMLFDAVHQPYMFMAIKWQSFSAHDLCGKPVSTFPDHA
jgi:hypothetical protein